MALKEQQPVPKDELTVAKINASIKILEWSKDDIEPGIGGSPAQLHVALAEAFRAIYDIVSGSVGVSTEEKHVNGEEAKPEQYA